jgi:DNA-binding SARP family transcriptional activator
MEFRILGPLEVHDDSAPVRVPGAKERALLADLLVNAGRVVPADRLVEDLWGEHPPGNPANTLQGRVSALRRALGSAGSGMVVTRPPGYALNVDPGQVDATRFERLVAEATATAAGDGPRAARLLEEALGLWRGPALAEFADQPWAQAEAARLEELRLAATEALVDLRLAAGGHAGLVGELEGLVAAHPTRERLRGQLMVALYRSGRQADALGAYTEAREVLAEELGIDPSPELQRLYQAILVQDPALEATTLDRGPGRHNLPERLTSLVGRDEELRELAKLVEQHRLVTVLGPGGAGKTSVAVELARQLAPGVPDGVWLVELAGLADPALLAEVVVAALGLVEEAGGAAPPPAPERLATFVADKALLLVLDNCEHLVGACAELAQRLLAAGPEVKVLATSRAVLGVPGEVVWPVPPLAVPEAPDPEVIPAPGGATGPGPAAAADAPEALARYDAVRLFWERAAAADPGFALDAASAPAVAELCRRLDGLPLAIELAAARVRFLPPAEIVARLGDRFGLLAGGSRTVAARQRTLRATVDWSWELLEQREQVLFRRPPRRSAPGTAWPPGRSWRGCSRWWTGRWWWPPGATRPGSGCWRPCGPTGPSGWPRPARPARWRPAIPPGSCGWPRRPPPTTPSGAGCGGSTPTTTTCGRCWTGPWPAATWTPPCGWPAPSAGTGGPTAPWRAASGWPRSWPWPPGSRRPCRWPGRSRRWR